MSHCKAPAAKDSLPRATPSLSCRELLPELLCQELLLVCCAESYSRAVVPRATRELLCRELLRVYRADTCAMLRNSVSCRTCGFWYGFRFHSNRESFKISSAAGRRPAGGWIVKRFLPKSCPGDRFPARKHCCVALRTLHVDPARRPHPAVPGEHATCSSVDSMIMTYVSLQH